jgi:hypothetical protein
MFSFYQIHPTADVAEWLTDALRSQGQGFSSCEVSVLVAEADKASSKTGTAPDQRLVSASPSVFTLGYGLIVNS